MLKRFFYSHEIILNHFHIIKEICQIQPFTGKSTKFPFLINHKCRYVTLHRGAFFQFPFRWINPVINPPKKKLAKRTSVLCTKLKFSQYRQSFAQNYLAILVCMHIPHIGLFVQYHSNHHHQNCSLMYQHCRHRNHFLVSTKICIHWPFLERTINKLDLESSFLFKVLHNSHFLLRVSTSINVTHMVLTNITWS